MAALADAPPARKVSPPAEAGMPKTNPEVIASLVKLGLSSQEISKAADLRLMLLIAIRDLTTQSAELGKHGRVLERGQAEVPDLVIRHALTLAASNVSTGTRMAAASTGAAGHQMIETRALGPFASKGALRPVMTSPRP
jgi:hypothetical protein